MQAIIQDSFGGPDVLRHAEVDTPRPGAGEVLVRVHAAGLNPVDAAVRAGLFSHLPEPPFTPGWDVAGVVERVGAEATGFHVGDEVFGLPRFPQAAGTHAEYVAVPAVDLAAKPAALTMAQAGALPMSGLTAWQALVRVAGIRSGQRVLIHAASGGVGHLAVQIAEAHGAHVVVTARAEHHAFLASLGADELIDYTAADFATATAPVDVVLDLVGGEYAPRSLRLLQPGGLLVTTVGHNPGISADEAAARGVRFETVFVQPSAADLAALAGLADEGRLTVHVDREIPLADAVKAHELAAGGGAKGKTVLICWS